MLFLQLSRIRYNPKTIDDETYGKGSPFLYYNLNETPWSIAININA